MSLMKPVLLVLLFGVGVLGARDARAADPVVVSLVGCYLGNGGQRTVPADSDVFVRLGWAEFNQGRVQSFLNSQTTTAYIDGEPVGDASAIWSDIVKFDDRFFGTTWMVFAGTLADPGDSLTVDFQVDLRNLIGEGKDPETGQPLFAGPGPLLPPDFGCQITAE